MKFKQLDKWIEQQNDIKKGDQQMREREQDAFRELQSLHALYESTLKESVTSGKDKTDKLDQVAEGIEQAKKAHERRKEERYMYSRVRPNEQLKPTDVVNAWNKEYIPQFREEKLDPALKELINAKKHVTKAMLDYFSMLEEFEEEQRATAQELGDSYKYKLQHIKLQTQKEVERYFVTERDLWYLSRKMMPESIKEIGGIK